MESKQFFISIGILLVLILNIHLSFGNADRLTRRRKTTSTTPVPAPAPLDEESITGREINLLKREQVLQERELGFREREVNLTLREEKLKEREYKLTVREDLVAKREKIVGKHGNCDDKAKELEKPDLYRQRFDPNTKKYYDIGSTEPCAENMRFFAVPEEGSNEGICDCDYHQCSRPLIYSKKYNQCFWAWSQGPCEQNHWIVFNETLQPTCEPNDCPSKSLSYGQPKFWFKDLDDGLCYESTTQGYCEGENERLVHIPEDPIPRCRTHSLCSPISMPAQQLCIPGNRRVAESLCPSLLE